MQKFIIVAIDGPAASGKSTLAKNLADRFNLLYVDTGAMYRAITLYALENNIVDDEEAIIEAAKKIDLKLQYHEGITRVFIGDKEVTDQIRSPQVNARVSDVSRIKGVRIELVKLQQRYGKNNNLVVEGRDTTTVVFPNADLKIFLTADAKERARRRHLEFQEKGIVIDLDEVEKSILNRDTIDSGRKVSPLRKADDAMEVDTTNLTVEQELERINEKIEELLKNKNLSHQN